LTRDHRVALDCGTGNGQAARGLAAHFDRVIGTDPSEEQIRRATSHERIEYVVARAESCSLPTGSVDLVTAAQALHWFDPAAFFAEAKRVLTAAGVIAIWGYGDPILDSVPLHQTLHQFNRGTLESYWFPERQLLLDGYQTIPFPFDELPLPALEMKMKWTLAELAGYLRTWSSAARYAAEHGFDPVTDVERALSRDWGRPDTAREVRWPLHIRAGTIPQRSPSL
jgi:SAM-dependent methyltransferase